MGAVFKATKAYMVSATTDKLENEILKALWGDKVCDQLKFQNLASVAKGKYVQPYEKSSQMAKDIHELKEKLEAFVRAEVIRKPLLIFDTSPDDAVNVDFEAICREAAVPFASIQTDKEAIEGRKLFAEETRGCFLLNRRYARSYDFKLGVNPMVVIRCPKGVLTMQEADQMCGRSCRDQGRGSAVLFMAGNTTISKEPWSRLNATEVPLPLGCAQNLV